MDVQEAEKCGTEGKQDEQFLADAQRVQPLAGKDCSQLREPDHIMLVAPAPAAHTETAPTALPSGWAPKDDDAASKTARSADASLSHPSVPKHATRPRRAAASHRIPANVLIGDLQGADACLASPFAEAGAEDFSESWPASSTSTSGGSSRPSRATLVSGGPCVECQAVKSTLFRKTPDGQPVCNACGLRLSRELQKQGPAHRSETGASPSDAGPSGASGRGRGISKYGGTGARGRRRKLPADGRRKCAMCGATNSPQWRYIQEDDLMACNACALRRYRNQERKQQAPVALRPSNAASGAPASQYPTVTRSQRRPLPFPAAPRAQREMQLPVQPVQPGQHGSIGALSSALQVKALQEVLVHLSQAVAGVACAPSLPPRSSRSPHSATMAAVPGFHPTVTGPTLAHHQPLALLSSGVQQEQPSPDLGAHLLASHNTADWVSAATAAAAAAILQEAVASPTRQSRQHRCIPGPPACTGSARDVPAAQPAQARPRQRGDREAIIQVIVDGLVERSLISAEEVHRYMALWRRLDSYRQEAAEAAFIDSIVRRQDLQLAVEHIRQVLQQNECSAAGLQGRI